MDIFDYKKGIEKICNFFESNCNLCILKDYDYGHSLMALNNQQIEEVIKIITGFKVGYNYCPNCEYSLSAKKLIDANYCPNCGINFEKLRKVGE